MNIATHSSYMEVFDSLKRKQKKVFRVISNTDDITYGEISKYLNASMDSVILSTFQLRQQGVVFEGPTRKCWVSGKLVRSWKSLYSE